MPFHFCATRSSFSSFAILASHLPQPLASPFCYPSSHSSRNLHCSDTLTTVASSTRKALPATGWPPPFCTITKCAFAHLTGAAPVTSTFVHSLADSDAPQGVPQWRPPISFSFASYHSIDN